MVPADDQAMVLPWASARVIMVLLNDAFTCATPEAMFLRSRRRTRVASLPIHDPFAAPAPHPALPCLFPVSAPLDGLLLAGDGLGRPLAGARVGMCALAPHRQAAAMPQPTVAAQIHQPLDIHCHVAPEIALHHIVTIDHFANLEYFLVGQLGHPALMRYPDLRHDFISVFWPNSMDILQRNDHALVSGYVYTGNSCHGFNSFAGWRPAG